MPDLRDAFRALRATPLVTVVAIVSLALGIGANTAIFSILDTLLLRALPVREPERLAIVSIAHLDESQRMFFVTILLNEVLSWIRSQPGTSSLRAILYMDEVFGYFPPLGNPPAKRPMLTLLKQARAYGLGCVLATQNPVDLDYKGLANAGTWFLGRLQTERDKARVIEGLEGASAQAGASFNRRDMEANDRAREAYVRHFYRCDPAEAAHYHLVVDSTALPIDTVVDLVVMAARGRGIAG